MGFKVIEHGQKGFIFQNGRYAAMGHFPRQMCGHNKHVTFPLQFPLTFEDSVGATVTASVPVQRKQSKQHERIIQKWLAAVTDNSMA
jgi:hypothetical protein